MSDSVLASKPQKWEQRCIALHINISVDTSTVFGRMCKQYPSVVDQLVRRHLEEYRGNLDAELGSLCAVGVVANGLMSDVTESPIHDMAQRAIRHLFARAAHDGAPDSCACTVIWSLVSRPKAGSEKKGRRAESSCCASSAATSNRILLATMIRCLQVKGIAFEFVWAFSFVATKYPSLVQHKKCVFSFCLFFTRERAR